MANRFTALFSQDSCSAREPVGNKALPAGVTRAAAAGATSSS
ncbi:hypothetical protein [Streptomyces sp.]|nr:hypothetical protein [Streptomyces sp.]